VSGKRRLAIDSATRTAVAKASDPAASAWVSANAGSGKTFVLSQRVVRLLLAGTDPGRILCLTFTKAAAAEMSKRVFAILSDWTTLSDEALAEKLEDLDGRRPEPSRLAAARRLFARALETPGGLKIQTIHAFCERLLHQFPFEANVAGHFEILDDRDALALKDEARRHVIERAVNDEETSLGRSLGLVLDHASDMYYELALAEFVEKRDQLRFWVGSNGLDDAIGHLRTTLGIAADESIAALRHAVLAESSFAPRDIEMLRDALNGSDKSNDRKAAERLAPYFTAAAEDGRIDAWVGLFTKTDGDLRSARGFVTKGVRDSCPGLDEKIEQEIARLKNLFERLCLARCFETTVAMLRLADAAIGEYERAKAARGALDFEDLVVKTAALLSRADARQWVQYKLDRGLDHILVDEAQDTNPRQWQVIRALAEEFFSGEGASEAVRTLFAVGDEKQSIFSFQGAVPAWFREVERALRRRAREAGCVFESVELHLSFRSTTAVLSAVDKVFAAEAARAGVTTTADWPFHTAARRNEPGTVVVWPMIEKPEIDEPEDWATPLDRLGEKSPEVTLAERIAATIAGWLRHGERIAATNELIRPGNILILTRGRGAQTDAINRALKAAEIPIAGADRLKLLEHIAVMDLMALGRIMLLPEDDLSLAAVLKSPLIGLDEETLFALAYDRKGSLWGELGAATDEASRAARARLDAWRAEAGWRDPFAFYARILGPDGGRKAFLKRLSAEAEEVIDEFLAQALAYEQANTPSLQGFLAWLDAAPTDIKRDTDTLRDEVRVMTVHGAKGLEAEIVFLVDTGSAPVHASHDPRVVALSDDPDSALPAPLVWMRSRKVMPPLVAARLDALRDRAGEEYRRLLYVALTRAKDQLYVCGTRKKYTDAVRGWHALVRNALEPESRRIEKDGELVALEWRSGNEAWSLPLAGSAEEGLAAELELPAWIDKPVSAAAPAAKRVSPSSILRLGEMEERLPLTRLPDQPSRRAALERGRIVHRLLQALPEHPPERRREIGERFLAAVTPALADEPIIDRIMAILDDPVFAPLFLPGSRAEVEIAGSVATAGTEAVVSGRIDRLAVSPDGIFIVDYKTDREPPASLDLVPRAYLAQLATYAVILKKLYPGRPLRAALLWTETPMLMDMPEGSLKALETAISAV
jgi:ATP-dependent helicase/nuclease subunit A